MRQHRSMLYSSIRSPVSRQTRLLPKAALRSLWYAAFIIFHSLASVNSTCFPPASDMTFEEVGNASPPFICSAEIETVISGCSSEVTETFVLPWASGSDFERVVAMPYKHFISASGSRNGVKVAPNITEEDTDFGMLTRFSIESAIKSIPVTYKLSYKFRESVTKYESACDGIERLRPPSKTLKGKSNLVGWRAGGWKKLINKLSISVKTADGKLILVGNDEVLSSGNRTEASDSKVAVDFGRMTAGQFGRIHMFVAQTGTEVCSIDQSCIRDLTARGFSGNVANFFAGYKWKVVCGVVLFLFIAAFVVKEMWFSKNNAYGGSGRGGGHYGTDHHSHNGGYGGGDCGGGGGGGDAGGGGGGDCGGGDGG